MDISSEKSAGAVVVHVSGELDLGTAHVFRARVDADLDRLGGRDLVLEFSGVGFVDSSGLGAILGRYKRVADRGGKVVLCGCRPHVRRLLELSGLMRIVRAYPDLEAALLARGEAPVRSEAR